MKTRTILNPKKIDTLFDHIIGGYVCSREGIAMLKREGHIKLEDYIELVEKNQDRLIDRIKEFRIVNKLLSLVFACLFSYLQINGDDLEVRKPSRTRGRRRNETEKLIEV